MSVRLPVVAGQFYPASADQCQAEVQQYLSAAVTEGEGPRADRKITGDQAIDLVIGGIVPHAGWICSGAVAAEVINVLAAHCAPETFVVFGAVHRLTGSRISVYASGSWRTPLGDVLVDEELAAAVVQASSLLVDDPAAHQHEHSIEVQVPFIQHLAPSAKLLPVMVPPTASAPQAGRIVAEQVRTMGRNAVFLGSTDLTHYGPRYDFTAKGTGPEGLKWAKEANDRRIIDLILDLQAEKVLREAAANRNACGSGAIAAAIGAARESGADRAQLLRHTTSCEVLRERLGQMTDAVGYAGVVFG